MRRMPRVIETKTFYVITGRRFRGWKIDVKRSAWGREGRREGGGGESFSLRIDPFHLRSAPIEAVQFWFLSGWRLFVNSESLEFPEFSLYFVTLRGKKFLVSFSFSAFYSLFFFFLFFIFSRSFSQLISIKENLTGRRTDKQRRKRPNVWFPATSSCIINKRIRIFVYITFPVEETFRNKLKLRMELSCFGAS